MACPRCTQYYSQFVNGRPDYLGSDPKCGFDETGYFTKENWQCRTLNLLREICDNEHPFKDNTLIQKAGLWIFSCRRADRSTCLIYLPEYDLPDSWINLMWYKNRGGTDVANCSQGLLTIEIAEEVIKTAVRNGMLFWESKT